ncbi:hypothetical protein F2Q69_00016282 [Brassica cretica]|uniref:Replication factor A C-terminal domain-containing protein n=1 Tax=Brassica cretica TaxID=69181 RepID=A0A8S9R2M3_BRACR|nr:hypothetical protein F2Q69_00016282 [Brassica cretica]
MTIADLSSFIVSAASQEIDFLCTGRVVRIDTDKEWCYVACSKCSKKLQRTESAFTCGVCNNPQAVGALRYRVEMAISDDTAEGIFVWFDGVLTKLHSIRASEAAQMLVTPFIADMEGKTYTFQVRVTAFNFTEHHKTFTITRIAEDHGRLPADDVVNNGDDDDDDNDDASPAIEPSTAAGDQGGTSKARKKTGAGASKVVKKARAGCDDCNEEDDGWAELHSRALLIALEVICAGWKHLLSKIRLTKLDEARIADSKEGQSDGLKFCCQRCASQTRRVKLQWRKRWSAGSIEFTTVTTSDVSK